MVNVLKKHVHKGATVEKCLATKQSVVKLSGSSGVKWGPVRLDFPDLSININAVLLFPKD